jgi:hypothetical protein
VVFPAIHIAAATNASSGHPPAAAAQALNYFALRSALPATSMLPIDGRKKFSTLTLEGSF